MISLRNVSKSFGLQTLFSGVSFHIGPRDRLALLGANGTGKTTLLEIITGQIPCDEGQCRKERHATIGYLRQEPENRSTRPVIEEVTSGSSYINRLVERIQTAQAELALAHPPAVRNSWLSELGELQHRLEAAGAYDLEHEAGAILSGLGFRESDFSRAVNEFSGGWIMRIELARTLIICPDLLLLDEPTNHLDLEAQLWFEKYLGQYRGAVLLTSHDRAFLNRVVKRVIMLENQRATVYAGNYDACIETRRRERELLKATAYRQSVKLAKENRFIERFRYKNTKATQVQSRIKMLARVEKVEVPRESAHIHFKFPEPPRPGDEAIRLSHISKSYGTNQIYRNIDLTIRRGHRVALVGPNGAGKTTLLKIMAGILPFESGSRTIGYNVVSAYYAQHQLELLDERNSVLSELMTVTGPSMSEQEARSILGGFFFRGDDVNKKIGVLSGGEKARLALAKMLTQQANLLLLDEPTNHLDIASREVLADALAAYQGTLCFITHDRTLINQIADTILEIRAGSLNIFPGNYESYLYHVEHETPPEAVTSDDADLPKNAALTSRARREAIGEMRNRFNSQAAPLKAEITELEDRLHRSETEKAAIETDFSDPARYSDSDQVIASQKRHKKLSTEIPELAGRWEECSLALEKLRAELDAALAEFENER